MDRKSEARSSVFRGRSHPQQLYHFGPLSESRYNLCFSGASLYFGDCQPPRPPSLSISFRCSPCLVNPSKNDTFSVRLRPGESIHLPSAVSKNTSNHYLVESPFEKSADCWQNSDSDLLISGEQIRIHGSAFRNSNWYHVLISG